MTEQLRILFLSPYIPSLIRVRPYNLIRTLSKRGHRITLLALQPSGEDTSALSELGQWCEAVQTVPLPRTQVLENAIRALPIRTPFQAAYSRSPHMKQALLATLRASRYDLIHLEHLRGAELLRGVDSSTPPVVFDAVDSISLLFDYTVQHGPNWRSRLLARLDLGRTRRYEGRYPQRFSHILVTSQQDQDALVALSNRKAVRDQFTVLPNGVDLGYFEPLNVPREADTIIFSGKMSYHANAAAALDLVNGVMPLVWRERPEAKVWLVGKDPSALVSKLAADPRVTVTGTVPDIRPYLGRAAVAVCPLRYSVGIQNKVLEAMAMATPVITTPTACRALMTETGVHLMVGDTAESLAQAILSLLTDEGRRCALGDAGRDYVVTHHDWDRIAARLETVYRKVLRTSDTPKTF